MTQVQASFDRAVATSPFSYEFGGRKARAAKREKMNPSGSMVTKPEAGSNKAVTRDVQLLTDKTSPSCWNVFLNYVKEVKGLKNAILKPVSTVSEWIVACNPSLLGAKKISVLGKQTKNLASAAEIPESAVEVVRAASQFKTTPDTSNFANLANKFGRLTLPVIEVFRVVSDTVSPMATATAKTVGVFFNTMLTFTTGYSTVEELGKINEEKAKKIPDSEDLKGRVLALRDANLVQSQLKLVTNVSYLALGVLGLATSCAGVVVPSLLTLALATNGLAFTLLSHFQKKLHVETLAKVAPIAV